MAASREIDPASDWCEAIGTLAPGGELVLRPGDYPGPCTIMHGGAPGAPIVVRGQDPRDPPRIVYSGTATNVLHIRASHIILRGLRFGPTAPDIDAIRLIQGHDVTIEDNVFDGLGGIALTVNHTSTHGIVIRGNTITASESTALYLGCHDGRSCAVSGLLVEGNYINGVRAAPDEIGYGIQVKLNSTAIIRDNVIVNTKGPGIMVYGSTDTTQVSLVERNFVAGSRTSSAIVIGGGPAIVRNNIALASAEAGIGLEDYGRRGLLRGIVVVHNTVYDNAQGGIVVPSTAPLEVRILNNAVHTRPGTPALPSRHDGTESSGNVDCTTRPCFRDPSLRDFSPLRLPPGATLRDSWAPTDDYFGARRGAPPVPGAIEAPAGPVGFERKAMR
jgi:parallel beta helix pectate lyase-like protein